MEADPDENADVLKTPPTVNGQLVGSFCKKNPAWARRYRRSLPQRLISFPSSPLCPCLDLCLLPAPGM